MYTLNCPFDEKDQAKRAGARWYAAEKKWFVPKTLYHKIEIFNKWKPNGRMYLNCPFEEKDEAKKKGASFDVQLKKWYFIPGRGTSKRDFAKWLPGSKASREKKAKALILKKVQALVDKKVEAIVDKKMKALEASSTPTSTKVTPAPTPAQMELYQMSHFASGNMGNSNNNIPMNMNSSIPPWMNLKTPEALQWMNQQMNNPMNLVSPPINPNKRKNVEVVKEMPVKKKSSNEDSINIHNLAGSMGVSQASQSLQPHLRLLPRIDATLKKAQLSHELLHRDPSVTGLSNKKKQWFLDRLGLGSVWTSSPQCKGINIDSVPRVTIDMTIAQLSHELLERNPAAQKDMLGKSRTWYIEKLCIGSLWITAADSCGNNNNMIAQKPTLDSEANVHVDRNYAAFLESHAVATSKPTAEPEDTAGDGNPSIKAGDSHSSTIGGALIMSKEVSEAKALAEAALQKFQASVTKRPNIEAVDTTNLNQLSIKAEVALPSTIGGAMIMPKEEGGVNTSIDNKYATFQEPQVIATAKQNVKAEDTAGENSNQSLIKAEVIQSSTSEVTMKRPKMESEVNASIDRNDAATENPNVKAEDALKTSDQDGNDDVSVMIFPEAIYTPKQSWEHFTYRPQKKTGLAYWESSYQRFTIGEHSQAIAASPLNGCPIQANTVISHIFEALLAGRPVNLRKLSSEGFPPTKAQWDILKSIENGTDFDVTGDPKISGVGGGVFKLTDFLASVMGDDFIKKGHADRTPDEKAKFSKWCQLLKWYTTLRRIQYTPIFKDNVSSEKDKVQITDGAEKVEVNVKDEDSAEKVEVNGKDEDSAEKVEVNVKGEDSVEKVEVNVKDKDSAEKVEVNVKDEDSADEDLIHANV